MCGNGTLGTFYRLRITELLFFNFFGKKMKKNHAWTRKRFLVYSKICKLVPSLLRFYKSEVFLLGILFAPTYHAVVFFLKLNRDCLFWSLDLPVPKPMVWNGKFPSFYRDFWSFGADTFSRKKLPVKVHISGKWLWTVIEDKSVKWSEGTMKPHFKELFTFNLNKTSILRNNRPLVTSSQEAVRRNKTVNHVVVFKNFTMLLNPWHFSIT